MAESARAAVGATGSYESCVKFCKDEFASGEAQLECIRGCGKVYGGGVVGVRPDVTILDPVQLSRAVDEFLSSSPQSDEGVKTLARAIGGFGAGSTRSCLEDCETEYSKCINGSDDWFQRYLCKLDATKCVLKCGLGAINSGGIVIA